MKISVTDSTTITEIQKTFETQFEYLKLVFFKKPHAYKEGSAKKDALEGDIKLASLTNMRGEFTIEETMTVNELESAFKEKFGLHVQVFRKSGNTWIETTVTDAWSLKKQNEQGKELSQLSF